MNSDQKHTKKIQFSFVVCLYLKCEANMSEKLMFKQMLYVHSNILFQILYFLILEF